MNKQKINLFFNDTITVLSLLVLVFSSIVYFTSAEKTSTQIVTNDIYKLNSHVITEISTNSAKLTLLTSKASTSMIEYGVWNSYDTKSDSWTALNSASQVFMLNNLAESTTYNYKITTETEKWEKTMHKWTFATQAKVVVQDTSTSTSSTSSNSGWWSTSTSSTSLTSSSSWNASSTSSSSSWNTSSSTSSSSTSSTSTSGWMNNNGSKWKVGPAVAVYYATPTPVEKFKNLNTLITETSALNPTMLKALQANGTKVYGYVSVWEVGTSRGWDLSNFTKLGTNRVFWGAIMDMSDPDWTNFLVKRSQEIIDKWYDGIFLDTMDSWQAVWANQAQQTAGIAKYVNTFATSRPNAGIISNRGFEVFDRIKQHLDAVAVESIYGTYDPDAKKFVNVSESNRNWVLGQLAKVKALWVDVIAIEFANDQNRQKEIVQKVQALGYYPYVSPTFGFNQLGATLPKWSTSTSSSSSSGNASSSSTSSTSTSWSSSWNGSTSSSSSSWNWSTSSSSSNASTWGWAMNVNSTWTMQLQWGINASKKANVFFVDLADNSNSGLFKNIQSKWWTVICYFSAGTHENWRADVKSLPWSVIGKPLWNWPWEKWLDVRSDAVVNLMYKRMDDAKKLDVMELILITLIHLFKIVGLTSQNKTR